MQRTFFAVALLALAAVATVLILPASAAGGAHWKLLTPIVTASSTGNIRVQLVDGVGSPIANPAVTSVRVDMSPDAMAAMTAPAKILPAKEPGVVVVQTNLYAPGRWAVILTATVDGKPVKGSVVVTAAQKSAEAAPPPPASHRILYYRNPMGLADTSPVPKKDAMGMDYIPVYADQVTKVRGAVRLTTEKIQRAGVHTTVVMRMPLAKTVRATGTIATDENRQAVVTARFSGFIEKLFVSQTGDVVRAGEPLMRVWIESPEVLIKEADYIGSLASHSESSAAMAAAILRQYGVPQAELNAMKKSGRPTRTITITAPMSGTVMEKAVVEGMHFASGDTLFKITDVSHLWVLADVSERDLATVKPGQVATITFRDDPSASFQGKVLFVYPALDPVTRTVKVRIALANTGDRLRIGQYADVRIAAPVSKTPVLAVPVSAVLDDGTRQIAFVSEPGGMFEPRKLKLGARSGDMVEVLSGLKQGERVVTSGNFLIDAESNLETALQTFTPGPRQ
ncbi:MAG: efflux RND transporter periplasmic adaptor subunit [Alphaproteobacteria bacterium]|nr:efflux RND transporter periplasmic adaptor subunit [Alphaproteobacteria bacterium]